MTVNLPPEDWRLRPWRAPELPTAAGVLLDPSVSQRFFELVGEVLEIDAKVAALPNNVIHEFDECVVCRLRAGWAATRTIK